MTTISLDLAPTSRLSLQTVRAFYAQPLARRVLLASSILLAYGGGAAMFWLHAIHRGERARPSTTGSTGCWTPRWESWP